MATTFDHDDPIPTVFDYDPERLSDLRLYVENQGDKFHPLSDRILHAFSRADAAGTGANELIGVMLNVIQGYEADPDGHPDYSYHIGRLRGALEIDPEDWS